MVTPAAPTHRDAPATVASWQYPPQNRWAFWHIRELLPTQRIAAPTASRALPVATDPPDLRGIRLSPGDEAEDTRTVGTVLDESFTDAWLVFHDGELVAESYAADGGPDRPHAVMSITKSVVSCVAALLVDEGRLSLDDLVTDHVPELADTAWAGARVADVLDMRSGVDFREDYTDPTAEVRLLDDWIGWRPRSSDDAPRGLYAFLETLDTGEPHGGPFRYRSAEADVLGWVCERAAGTRMADLISTSLWGPMGAERDADIICDGLGTAIHDGGLCATARDLARFGRLLLDGGAVQGPDESVQLVPARWLRTAWSVDASTRGAFVASPAEASFPGGWYRHQFWFRPGEAGDVLLCLGIHGQLIHVSPRTHTVCVKLSTWPTAQDPKLMQDTLRACDAVGSVLARLERRGDRRGLARVVAGLSRHPGGRPPTVV